MFQLEPHQEKVLSSLHSGAVLLGGTGSGKSITSLAFYFCEIMGGRIGHIGVKKEVDLLIITTPKNRDDLKWESELAYFSLSPDPKICPYKINIIVDSWNNIKKYTEIRNQFVIFDEQRIVGSGVWAKSFIKIAKQNQWLLLTATPGDTWMDYWAIFVANGYYKNITEYKREHVVYKRYVTYPAIERYIGCDKLVKLKQKVLIDMEYEKKTVSHLHVIEVAYDESAYKRAFKDRWNEEKNKPIKNASELCYLLRKIVNSHDSRCQEILKVHKIHPKLIVFYNFNYELELLREMCRMYEIPFAEWNGIKHEEIPDTKEWIYLVQYTAGAEGWECITTNATLFYSQTYSYKVKTQAKGRIDRLNTPFSELNYYDLISQSSIDKAIQNSLLNKKIFNQKKFAG